MSRRQARETAVRWLYEHDVAGTNPNALKARDTSRLDGDSQAFASTLLEGVLAHRAALDAHLGHFAKSWRVERMSPVDRAILRIGLFELMFEPKTPTEVLLSEAVELAGLYSTPEGKRFINGVLSAASKEVRSDAPN